MDIKPTKTNVARTAILVMTCIGGIALFAQAPVDNVWLGNTDTKWQTASNWSENDAPNNSDTNQFNAVFNNPADSTYHPDTDGGGPNRDVNRIIFNQAGWTISGGGKEIQFF